MHPIKSYFTDTKFMFNAILSDKTGTINFVYFGGVNHEQALETYAPLKMG